MLSVIYFLTVLSIVPGEVATEFRKGWQRTMCYKRVLLPVPADDIGVYLFNKDHYNYKINISNLEGIEVEDCYRIRIVIHGFEQQYEDILPLIDEYIHAMPKYTIIGLKWTKFIKDYHLTFTSLKTIGLKVEHIISRLETAFKTSAEYFHFLGFGLGAHILGHAGRRHYPAKFGVIVGLDPTASGFDEDLKGDRAMMLGADCAIVVRIIHTNAAQFGVRRPMGHMDFYINGGFLQPGCPDSTIHQCSHLRVMDYIKELIKKKNCYDAYHCASIYDLYYNHECQVIPRKRLVYDIFEVAKDVK
ncbi:inactive pancreatic lipase-related protein 1-like [Ctenocephalides felis]|uniref:inactive pancreatic lipase-related protein 1-like n=1 Tax=Ctenocephalides felis TaxID=7515 RepID=UPI000E6E3B3A|nr:inactive pancreatic lipase-related protein 1-like [Ctenocephalides felis]